MAAPKPKPNPKRGPAFPSQGSRSQKNSARWREHIHRKKVVSGLKPEDYENDFETVGAEIGCSFQRASQIQDEALSKLRCRAGILKHFWEG